MSNTLLNHPIISQRYFFPRVTHFNSPFWVHSNDIKLACHYHQIHPQTKTLVHFHGNGEIVSDYLPDFPLAIELMGCNCFLAEYRGYGMSTGAPALAAMLTDVEHIINSIGQPPEKLVVFGRSLGSIYAIHAASLFPNIAGLIIESGIADPLQRLLIRLHPGELNTTSEQLEAAINRTLNHQQKLATYQGATLIMHTQNDGMIDVTHAHQLYDWAPEPKELKIFQKGNHNNILAVNAPQYFGSMQKFIQSL